MPALRTRWIHVATAAPAFIGSGQLEADLVFEHVRRGIREHMQRSPEGDTHGPYLDIVPINDRIHPHKLRPVLVCRAKVLERLAVEEPVADGEPQTIAARLLVNAVEPRGAELLQRLLDAGDDRAIEVKRTLDELAHGREVGDWITAEAAARRLVGWVVL